MADSGKQAEGVVEEVMSLIEEFYFSAIKKLNLRSIWQVKMRLLFSRMLHLRL